MYLILSVVFFLLASVDDPGEGIEIGNGPEGTNLTIGGPGPLADSEQPGSSPQKTGAAEPDSAQAPAVGAPPGAADAPSGPAASGADTATTASTPRFDAATQRAIDEVVKRVPPADRAEVRANLENSVGEIPASDREAVASLVSDPCSKDNLKLEVGGLERYEARLRLACNKIMDDQATFGRALWNNIPKAMFIFLPLLAGVMSLLYLGSRRYYVEHLVFFVHYHAFFFLAGIAVLAFEQLGDPEGSGVARGFDTLANVVEFLCVFYVPWYLFRAMRRVYGQGRIWTFTKFLVLTVAYIGCFVLTFIGLLFYTALSL